ncbi:hypothetical protein PTSG_08844 [Salpingoeca rosetta]|uniref:DNA-directed RNA polymerase subunit n=1 Tax=Salpingoeca rosetta (strain ATCC 50818 / BSB-021) TaxID=946362 RepID=F2UKV6_SALR5|nr:uncharacterized protein PTSG_08844 [Salpingoeca rosetta]EGD77755.1 hypothetical protein PTSG_08844 [Salpingoeca rosetta]|eukprot:XP_004990231.1 hypothetical protein PTSG_08844 [Salpingoeca rosetta]
MSAFKAPDRNFCVRCGALLPTFGDNNTISCRRCGHGVPVTIFENVKVRSSSRPYAFQKPDYNTSKEVEDTAATIDEKCPKCGREEMSYTTAQLRSADEGQTIFYRCKCGYSFSVNS